MLTIAFILFLALVLVSLAATFLPVPASAGGSTGGRADERTVHSEAFVSPPFEAESAEQTAVVVDQADEATDSSRKIRPQIEPRSLKEAA